MARTFPEHDKRIILDRLNDQPNPDNPDNRPISGSGKIIPKNKPKPRKPVLNLAQMQAGFNIRVFPHRRRLVVLVMHTKPDHVTTATHQVYDALKTGKTCLISASKGYKCLLLNIHAVILSSVFVGIFYTSNPEQVKQFIMMLFNIK